MQVLELMKTYVVSTTPDATVSEAVDLMDLHQVSGVPVVDEQGKLVGYISESDVERVLLGKSRPGVEKHEFSPDMKVDLVMSRPGLSVQETVAVSEAAMFMLARNVTRVPVLDEERTVVGTLNRIDILQAIMDGHFRYHVGG